MSWPYPPLPPDTQATGTGAPAANFDQLRDYVAAVQGRVKAGVYDPRDYGAVGDGATDDTTAILGCIAAMPAVGGVIQLHGAPQSYLISAPIALSPNQVAIGSHLNAWSPGGGIKADITCSATFSGLAAIADSGALASGASPVADNPVSLFGVSIDLSLCPGTTTDGIRIMSFGAWVYFCEVKNAPASGIHVTNVNAGSNALTAPLTQVRICRNVVNLSGNSGILCDGSSGTAPTDCYCLENVVRQSATNLTGGAFNSTGAAIDLEFSADWHVSRNHVYSCPVDGIIIKQMQTGFVDNNFVDHFGLAGAASTTYHGINLVGVTGGPATHFNNNSVWADESFGAASTVYEYFAVSTIGAHGYVSFTDNTADQVVTGPGTSWAKTFAGGTGTLNVIEKGTILSPQAASPTTSAVNNLSGTVNLVYPGATCLTSGTQVSVPVGLSGAYGTMTTLISPVISGTAMALLGYQVFWGGTFSSDSCVFQVTATYDDGSTTTYASAAVTSVQNQSVAASDMAALFKAGRQVVKLAAQAKTSQASTSVTCTVTAVAVAA